VAPSALLLIVRVLLAAAVTGVAGSVLALAMLRSALTAAHTALGATLAFRWLAAIGVLDVRHVSEARASRDGRRARR
jgi:hypothetical protein